MAQNITAIIANTLLDFEKEDAVGLIDENRLYDDAIRALKKFGNDITGPQEYVVSIKGFEGNLPSNFAKIREAYLCEPKGYEHRGARKLDLQNTMIYKERIERSSKWNDCESCCETQESNTIIENVYMDTDILSFVYDQPKRLTVVNQLNKHEYCSPWAKNLFESPTKTAGQVRISGQYLQTNFEDGEVYIKYDGYPTDEEGIIEIPSTFNDHLFNYIQTHLWVKTAERLIMANEASQGIQSLYPMKKQEEMRYGQQAADELKMRQIPKAMKKWRLKNRQDTMTYFIQGF
jgi:hypothetical protein